MSTTVTVRAVQYPLWLCFEPWATEYTVSPGTTIVVHFNNETPIELTHHTNGITFMSFGRHPDIWSEDGQPMEIFSDSMPRTPSDVSVDVFRSIISAIPPSRPDLP